jgi:hypothetical protein
MQLYCKYMEKDEEPVKIRLKVDESAKIIAVFYQYSISHLPRRYC